MDHFLSAVLGKKGEERNDSLLEIRVAHDVQIKVVAFQFYDPTFGELSLEGLGMNGENLLSHDYEDVVARRGDDGSVERPQVRELGVKVEGERIGKVHSELQLETSQHCDVERSHKSPHPVSEPVAFRFVRAKDQNFSLASRIFFFQFPHSFFKLYKVFFNFAFCEFFSSFWEKFSPCFS